MAAKKAAADTSAPEAVTTKAAPLPPVQDGVGVVADRAEPTLDLVLADLRDTEAARLESVTVEPREEPTIDPALVEARDKKIAAQADAVAAASGSK